MTGFFAETSPKSAHSDEAVLHRFGYAQVLYRGMGEFSNFGISFTIISVLAGCLTSYYLAFQYGGPVAITWGWLLVGVFCVLVSMAMAEIASSMPIAGALYFWASKLGGPSWGWFTGWFNLIGQIAVTASIDYGAATFTTALLNLWFPGAVGTDSTAIFITYTVIVGLHLALNLLRINILAVVYSLSVWWHVAGIAIIVVVMLIVPMKHQSVAFVFGQTLNNSGFGTGTGFGHPAFWLVFGIGLLMAQYTITGFDASAHMSEETQATSRTAARGMIASVGVSVTIGFTLLVAVTFAVPDVQGTLDAGANAVVYIWSTSMNDAWAAFLLLIAVVAQFFCGTASLTSASRMLFAFSRDDAVPGSQLFRKLSPKRVPVPAAIAIASLAWLLMAPTLVNGAVGYLVGTSIAVIGLYISYGIPVLLRIRAGEGFARGAWHLGRHYRWIDALAVGWIALVCLLFLLPVSPNGIPGAAEFDWNVVNYAPLTVGAALALFGGWYLMSARHWFTGPVVSRAVVLDVPQAGSPRPQRSQARISTQAVRGDGAGGRTAADVR
jgi:amino acid transporter